MVSGCKSLNLLILFVWLGSGVVTSLPAQGPRPDGPGPAPGNVRRPPQHPPNRPAPGQVRLGEGTRPRPAMDPLRIQQLGPELTKILTDWSNSTSKIEKLEGTHRRYTYDHVFGTEKHAVGKFFYEAPDKGRIDVEPVDIKNGAVGRKKDKAGKPYSLKKDRQEKWVCDGKRVMQVDDEAKVVNVFPIPPQAQGKNIMNGPLPFLFGMPPETAKRRFHLTLLKHETNTAWIKAIPRLKANAANWKEAEIILSKKTWVPIAVKLLDPAGNKETVYAFTEKDLKINKPQRILFPKNPFAINIANYKIVQKVAQNNVQGVPKNLPDRKPAPQQQERNITPQQNMSAQKTTLKMPNVIGQPAAKVRDIFTKAGYKPLFYKGKVTKDPNKKYIVYLQSPAPGTPLKGGEKFQFKFHTPPETAQNVGSN